LERDELVMIAEPPKTSETPATEPGVRSRPTLLICDDEDGPRESLKAIFKGDFELLQAHSGPEAIQLAQQNRVDVAISDIRMPGMSGIEVLERLKFVDPGIEVVMMTAYETTDTLRQALKLHACDYINKPFDVATVRAAVASAMQRRRLRAAENDSEGKVEELFAELQSHKIQEQIAHARNEIYASIIHDINGPLTVISGFVQLMNQRLAGTTEPSAADLEFIKDRLKTIHRQTANCIEISRRYLSFLRRSENEEHARVGVNQLLADLDQLVREHPSLGSHQFTIHPLERDIGVRMNGTDLLQILRNLAVNAFQASHMPHTVEISGRVLDEPLDLSLLRDGPQDRVMNVESCDNVAPLVMLRVRDTGPGIAGDILPKVFQPYFTTKSEKQGTGLGLSIILRLVKQAGGVLHLHSLAGEGTTFTIYLPASRAASGGQP
jgi:two-component system, sensor histidine kinase and response regulator